MEKYEYLGRCGAGAYGTVWKCRDKEIGALVAVKKIERVGQGLNGILREVCLLQVAKHKHVVHMLAAHQGRSGAVYLVFELVDRPLSRELFLNPRGLPAPKLKLIMWQLLEAISFLHSKEVVHCDLKPANVLLTAGGAVKLCDLGSARSRFLEGMDVEHSYAGSRWYSAPESLVGDEVGPAVDLWSVGCIFGELAIGKPLMPGQDVADQLAYICQLVGGLSPRHMALLEQMPDAQKARLAAPTDGAFLDKLPYLTPDMLQLLRALLQPHPNQRPTAQQAMQMPYFADIWQAREAQASPVGHFLHSAFDTTAAHAQSAQRTQQFDRLRVSALTASMKMSPLGDDGEYVDLMEMTRPMVERWHKPQHMLSMPIAAAAETSQQLSADRAAASLLVAKHPPGQLDAPCGEEAGKEPAEDNSILLERDAPARVISSFGRRPSDQDVTSLQLLSSQTSSKKLMPLQPLQPNQVKLSKQSAFEAAVDFAKAAWDLPGGDVSVSGWALQPSASQKVGHRRLRHQRSNSDPAAITAHATAAGKDAESTSAKRIARRSRLQVVSTPEQLRHSYHPIATVDEDTEDLTFLAEAPSMQLLTEIKMQRQDTSALGVLARSLSVTAVERRPKTLPQKIQGAIVVNEGLAADTASWLYTSLSSDYTVRSEQGLMDSCPNVFFE